MPSKKRSGTRAERRRPKIVFFLDRCTNSRTLVTALTAVGAFVELHADHFEDDISDEGWLPVVGAKRWVVLTNDKRIRHRRIECQALLAAGIRAFVLTAGHLSSAAAAWRRALNRWALKRAALTLRRRCFSPRRNRARGPRSSPVSGRDGPLRRASPARSGSSCLGAPARASRPTGRGH